MAMEPTVQPAEIRVAILEDQRVLRDSLAEVLEETGIRVVVSSGDPELFFARLEAERPLRSHCRPYARKRRRPHGG